MLSAVILGNLQLLFKILHDPLKISIVENSVWPFFDQIGSYYLGVTLNQSHIMLYLKSMCYLKYLDNITWLSNIKPHVTPRHIVGSPP